MGQNANKSHNTGESRQQLFGLRKASPPEVEHSYLIGSFQQRSVLLRREGQWPRRRAWSEQNQTETISHQANIVSSVLQDAFELSSRTAPGQEKYCTSGTMSFGVGTAAAREMTAMATIIAVTMMMGNGHNNRGGRLGDDDDADDEVDDHINVVDGADDVD